uniref:Uncharacterized protein n=1 Tax=Aureoumbra lagunensis TaxID=44058 RepID=A0A7S3NMW5_9STRA|mmetsp:Transcript_11471/g.15674  ORF Transcript_11471/g.15674 Transcript_11471/m.15674 type:complete len:263 (+) Transcript_11471:71-859(+)
MRTYGTSTNSSDTDEHQSSPRNHFIMITSVIVVSTIIMFGNRAKIQSSSLRSSYFLHSSMDQKMSKMSFHQPKDNMTFQGIDCSTFDDDNLYPYVEGYPKAFSDCEEQDSKAWCEDCHSSSTCTKYCGNTMALCAHNPHGVFQFVNPCLWEMIANLPGVCADTFQNSPPLHSRNIGTTVSGPYVPPIRSCDFHSMCQACADETQPYGLNKFCRAIILHYNFEKRSARHFFTDLIDDAGSSYWCQPEILRSIEDLTFFSTLES